MYRGHCNTTQHCVQLLNNHCNTTQHCVQRLNNCCNTTLIIQHSTVYRCCNTTPPCLSTHFYITPLSVYTLLHRVHSADPWSVYTPLHRVHSAGPWFVYTPLHRVHSAGPWSVYTPLHTNIECTLQVPGLSTHHNRVHSADAYTVFMLLYRVLARELSKFPWGWNKSATMKNVQHTQTGWLWNKLTDSRLKSVPIRGTAYMSTSKLLKYSLGLTICTRSFWNTRNPWFFTASLEQT